MSKVLRIQETAKGLRWIPPSVVRHVVRETPVLPSTETAEDILRAATEEADSLRMTALSDAEQCRQQAYLEGYAHGLIEVETRCEAALQEKLTELERQAAEIDAAREAFLHQATGELVRLSVTIAERILTRQLTLAPELVVEMIRAGLARIHEREKVTIHLHPEDVPRVRQALPELSGEDEGERRREIYLEDDLRVGRGGAMLETPDGSYDLRLPSQLDVVRQALEEAMGDTGELPDV